MADVPAWYWQVLGAVCGLGLGLFLGAMLRKRKGDSRTDKLPTVRTAGGTAPAGPPSTLQSSTLPLPRTARAPEPAQAAASTGEGPSQRLLERLRETNLDLNAKLRAATDQHARDLLERSQQQQSDQQRHERQLEELRQAHAAELSHLMTAMVEQVDTMQRDHANQINTLEGDIERLKRAAQTSAELAGNEALTRPVTMNMGGDMMRPLPQTTPPATRQR